MLRRFAETTLKDWLATARRKPLVLRGARQVGKSTLVRQFAASCGRRLCEINLERHLLLDGVFGSLDVRAIFRELEAICGMPIRDNDCILFLDEIQAVPRAIQALRYFLEERPSLPVIAAGSLLEFTLAEHSFPMPVGRIIYLHLGPMSFKEFLLAVEPELLSQVEQLGPQTPPAAEAHRRLLSRQRQYLFAGGMPEAVDLFSRTGSLQGVGAVQRAICETYLDDFSKYARKSELLLLQKTFQSIPRSIGSKLKYTNISRDDAARDVRRAVDLLIKARLCTPVYDGHCSGVPLLADIDEDRYKLVFLDSGLMAYLSGVDWLALQSLTDIQLVNEGRLAEQFVGQHLLQILSDLGFPRLVYWTREGRSSNAEVDFVWSRGPWIVPVEVKAGRSGSLRSLHQFVAEKAPPLAVRLDLNPPSMQVVEHRVPRGADLANIRFRLLSLPLYAVEELPRLVDRLRLEDARGPG